MAVTAIADGKTDFDHWLEARKGYLTSSAMFTWRGVNVPDWWGDTKEDIIQQKFHAADKVFDLETYVSMSHGTFDEENVMAKFGKAIGSKTEPCNKLFVNDRWPRLAASIDGFVYRPGEAPDLTLSQDSSMLNYLSDDMQDVIPAGEAILCEIKKSTSVKWQKEIPHYYLPQLQTQMHICEIPAAVIVAETIKRGDTQKWRLFWDMRAYLVLRDPTWERKLDEVNAEFTSIYDFYNGAQVNED